MRASLTTYLFNMSKNHHQHRCHQHNNNSNVTTLSYPSNRLTNRNHRMATFKATTIRTQHRTQYPLTFRTQIRQNRILIVLSKISTIQMIQMTTIIALLITIYSSKFPVNNNSNSSREAILSIPLVIIMV